MTEEVDDGAPTPPEQLEPFEVLLTKDDNEVQFRLLSKRSFVVDMRDTLQSAGYTCKVTSLQPVEIE